MRGDAAMEKAVDPAELILARRPVAEHRMHMAVDETGTDGGALGVDDRGRRFWCRRPCRPTAIRPSIATIVSASVIGLLTSPVKTRPMFLMTVLPFDRAFRYCDRHGLAPFRLRGDNCSSF